MSTQKGRATRAYYLLAPMALIALLCVWPPRGEQNEIATASNDMSRSSARATSSAIHREANGPSPVVSRALPLASSSVRAKSPTIHEIRVDKSVVCRGEENFVTVRATGPEGDDAQLRISLVGTDSVGSRIPFRLYKALAAQDMPKVLVEGHGGAEVIAGLPFVEVRECDVDYAAEVELQAIGASTDEWRFIGHVASGAFAARTYEWDFGDGTRLTASTPQVTHSYRFRQQAKRYSYFLVSVTMRDAQGHAVQASRALGMSNPAYARLHRQGEVALFANRSDRDDGEAHVQLYHAYRVPVNLERVEVRVRDHAGLEQLAGNFPAETLIGLNHLEPGTSADVHLALASVQLPDRRPLTLVFEVHGSSPDGLRANGVFSTVLQ